MAVKAVVDVDLAGFQRLYDLAQKYQQVIAKTPGPWQAVAGQANAALASTQATTVAMTTQLTVLSQIVSAQQATSRAAQQTATAWKSITGYAGQHVKNIKAAVSGLDDFILRHARLGALAGGLLGAGGLYGLDRLAGAASSGRQSALGLGVSYGQQQAFGVAFNRFFGGNAEGLLSAVTSATSNAEGRGNLARAGLTDAEISSGGIGASLALVRNLDKLAHTTDPRYFGNTATNRGLTALGLSDATLRTFLNSQPGEVNQAFGTYGTNAGTLNVSDDTLKKWQDLNTQFDLAKTKIQSTLIDGLAPLAPELKQLSDALAEFVKTALASPQLGQWIRDVADGFKTLSSWFTEPGKFKDFFFGKKDSGSIVDRAIRGAVEGDTSGIVRDPRAPRINFGSRLRLGNLDPELQEKLSALLASVPSELGTANISSGFRTHAEQEALRRNNPSGYPVAKGLSQHEVGRAADVTGNDAVMKYLHEHAKEFGLDFPVKGDPVHVTIKDDRRRGDATVKIDVQNNTGGNATVNASSMKGQ